MEKKGKTVRDILHFSVSTWVNFILGFVSTFILTRIFVPEVLGTLNLFYSTINALLSVVCLGLDSSFIRFYNEPPKGEDRVSLLIKLLSICLLATFSLALVTRLFFQETVTDFFLGSKQKSLFYCIVVGLFSQVILRFFNISHRMKMDIRAYNIQNILINVVTRLSVIIGAIFNRSSAKYAIIANVACMLLLTLVYAYKQRREWHPNKLDFDLSGYREVIKFGLYGVLSVVILHIYPLSSQLIVKSHLGATFVGVYASASFFSSILSALKGGFCTYWSAYMFANYSDDSKQPFIRGMHDYILLAAILFLVILLPLRSIIYLFIGSEYRASMKFFTLVLIFPLLQTVQETTCYGIPIAKKNYITMVISLASFAINLTAGLILIDKHQLTGVAFANCLAAVFSYTCSTIMSQRYYRSINSFFRSALGVSLIVFLSVIQCVIDNDILISIICLFILLLALVIYNKQVVSIIDVSKKYINKV